jgi:hypothetical protein
MHQAGRASALEDRIAEWRTHLGRRQALRAVDVEELEGHLRDQVAGLRAAGLQEEEAFLVAVKRMGDLDSVASEFAREYSERLWKQLVVGGGGEREPRIVRKEAMVAVGLAIAAAAAVKLPEVFGVHLHGDGERFFARNMSLFVLPLLTAYFVWKRRLTPAVWRWLAASFAVAAVFANIYPFTKGHTETLTAIHLPIAVWLAVGIAYAGGRWRLGGGRMDFVRFSGELLIYYTLIAFGGGVLIGFTVMMFDAIGFKIEWLIENWLVPCGALGAVLIGAWLVEAKQSVIENMAPVLTRVFTPLFTAVLLVFLSTMLWTGRGIDIARNVLIGFDLLLVVVLGLLVYSISAREAQAPPSAFDALQLLLVVSALVVDVFALAAIVSRISEFGFTPNRVAALGENLILLVNLAWSAWLYARFLRGRGTFGALERWQTSYVPVYSLWAAFVVIAFPPLFGYA